MAGVAKRLRHWIVVPALGGSIPLACPILYISNSKTASGSLLAGSDALACGGEARRCLAPWVEWSDGCENTRVFSLPEIALENCEPREGPFNNQLFGFQPLRNYISSDRPEEISLV